MINWIDLKLSECHPYIVNALFKKKCPEYKGYIIVQGGNQFEEDMCTIHALHDRECDMGVVAPTMDQLDKYIVYFKQLNSHIKCTTVKPKIEYMGVNDVYSTTLHFTF